MCHDWWRPIMFRVLLTIILATTALGCDPSQNNNNMLEVSKDSALKLSQIGVVLERADAEIDFRCVPQLFESQQWRCMLKIRPEPESPLSVERVPIPFQNDRAKILIQNGSQASQAALYLALGAFSETRETSNERESARKLVLDEDNLSFRCIRSREAVDKPYYCWIIISSEIIF